MMPRKRPPQDNKKPVRPDRIRRINGQSFAFVPHRFLRGGFITTLTLHERSLYLFLLLAADHNGVSYYSHDRICSILQLALESYIAARNGLMDKDLVAFDGYLFQVLSLPDQPVAQPARPKHPPNNQNQGAPIPIRQAIFEALDGLDCQGHKSR